MRTELYYPVSEHELRHTLEVAIVVAACSLFAGFLLGLFAAIWAITQTSDLLGTTAWLMAYPLPPCVLMLIIVGTSLSSLRQQNKAIKKESTLPKPPEPTEQEN